MVISNEYLAPSDCVYVELGSSSQLKQYNRILVSTLIYPCLNRNIKSNKESNQIVVINVIKLIMGFCLSYTYVNDHFDLIKT